MEGTLLDLDPLGIIQFQRLQLRGREPRLVHDRLIDVPQAPLPLVIGTPIPGEERLLVLDAELPFVDPDGHALPGMLREHGVQQVQVKIDVDTPLLGDYRRNHLVSLVDSLRDKVIALGLLDEQALVDHRAALMQRLENPETVLIDKPFVQAWGQKPS